MDDQKLDNQEHEPASDAVNESDISQNASFHPNQLPDEPEKLKSIVKDREETIRDLRLRNVDLQKKLDEREKVVHQLTTRLEQAAEQLDRIKRQGGSSGRVLAGIPAEVIDEQRELINDLKSAIAHWEDLQSTSAMGRFEAQLIELREMLADQMKLKKRLDKGLPARSSESAGEAPSNASSASAPSASGASSWEQMKAQLMGGDTAKPSPAPQNDISKLPASSSQAEGQQAASDSLSALEIEINERPEPVANLESAEQSVLVEAVKQRDEHINHLMDVIETLKKEAAVEDRKEMLKRQKELEEKLRQAEIEMSMERAKLAREAAQLKQMEEELKNPNARKGDSGEESQEKGNRWVRFLGSK